MKNFMLVYFFGSTKAEKSTHSSTTVALTRVIKTSTEETKPKWSTTKSTAAELTSTPTTDKTSELRTSINTIHKTTESKVQKLNQFQQHQSSSVTEATSTERASRTSNPATNHNGKNDH